MYWDMNEMVKLILFEMFIHQPPILFQNYNLLISILTQTCSLKQDIRKWTGVKAADFKLLKFQESLGADWRVENDKT